MAKIEVLSKEVTVYTQNDADYICITDIAKYKNAVSSSRMGAVKRNPSFNTGFV